MVQEADLEGVVTWVGWLNVLVLQWPGVRLAYRREGWYSWRKRAGITRTHYSLMLGVVPLTGWWGRYIAWGRGARLWSTDRHATIRHGAYQSAAARTNEPCSPHGIKPTIR